MTPEAQRIAIAEACGWYWATHEKASGTCWIQSPGTTLPQGWWREAIPSKKSQGSLFSIPDYLSDLNAMAEAEKVLTDEQQIRFIRFLVRSDRHYESVMKMDRSRTDEREEFVERHLHSLGWDEVWCFCFRATAAERAEAFLRTLNKWTDTNETDQPQQR